MAQVEPDPFSPVPCAQGPVELWQPLARGVRVPAASQVMGVPAAPALGPPLTITTAFSTLSSASDPAPSLCLTPQMQSAFTRDGQEN